MCCCLITWCCARKQKVAEETQEHTHEEARKHEESEGSPEDSENCSVVASSGHNLYNHMSTLRAAGLQEESYSSSASSVVSTEGELEDSRDVGTVHFAKNFVGVMTKQCYSVLNRECFGAENELKYNRDGKFVAKCCFVGHRIPADMAALNKLDEKQRQMLKSLGRPPHGSILLLLEHNATIGDLKREFSKRFALQVPQSFCFLCCCFLFLTRVRFSSNSVIQAGGV